MDAELPTPTELQTRFQFTLRQAQVAHALIARKTNREIAVLLGVAEKTVRHHTQRVLHKLAVKSRKDVRGRVVTGS